MVILQKPNISFITSALGFLLSLFPQKSIMLTGVGILLTFGIIWSYQEISTGVNWFRRLLGAIGLFLIGAYIYFRFAFVR